MVFDPSFAFFLFSTGQACKCHLPLGMPRLTICMLIRDVPHKVELISFWLLRHAPGLYVLCVPWMSSFMAIRLHYNVDVGTCSSQPLVLIGFSVPTDSSEVMRVEDMMVLGPSFISPTTTMLNLLTKQVIPFPDKSGTPGGSGDVCLGSSCPE